MSDKFKKSMDKIVVSDELRARILAAAEEKTTAAQPKSNFSKPRFYRQYAANLAACIALGLIAYVVSKNYIGIDKTLHIGINSPYEVVMPNIGEEKKQPVTPEPQGSASNSSNENSSLSGSGKGAQSSGKQTPASAQGSNAAATAGDTKTENTPPQTVTGSGNTAQSGENSGIIDEDIEQSALPPRQDDTNEGPLLSEAPDIGGGGQNGFSEFSPSDISEIAQKLGYSFKIPAYLPEGYEASNASLMFESLVQITYKSPQGEMTYRTEKTNEDISGDYTEYENIQSENINKTAVTLKGSKDNCSLAVWSSEGSSYSVHCLPEITYGEMIKIIENLK